MANTRKTKKEMVDYLIELISSEHIREDFRKNLMEEEDYFILYILNSLVDNNTNNILKSDDF